MQELQVGGRYTWQQSMLRVKDYKKSVEFYKKYFNMTLIDIYDFPQWNFSLYFMASIQPDQISKLPTPGTEESHKFLWNFDGVTLELTYNYDSEKDDKIKYHPGNTTINDNQKDGFGHIAFHVDDVYKFSEDLEKDGVEFKKRPDEGRMKGLAFAYDPDGYWVEIIKRPPGTKLEGQITFGQTMLRVKDAERSLKFYQEILQMKLVCKKHFDDFSLYFLATLPEGVKAPENLECQEAFDFAKSQEFPILELTHNHGTEKIEQFEYLNGNTEPHKGFGHIGFLVDDVYKACEFMESKGTQFQKKPDAGNIKGLAFAKDPDGYWIEVIKRGQVL